MRTVAVKELGEVDASFPVPFEVRLNASTWVCESILRVLPGRRLVLKARPTDAESPAEPIEVVLKLFIGAGRRRYRTREARGLDWLRAADLPVPGVVADLQDEGLSGLIIEYLPGARVIEPDDQATVEQAAQVLGRMHEAGLWQVDLHLKNFVQSADRLYAVDGDGVRRRANPVPLSRGLEDLALLAAQRPPQEDEGATGLLSAYLDNRPGSAASLDELNEKIRRARRGRVKRYRKKCFRSCTEFSVTEDDAFRHYTLRGRGELVRALLSERNAFTSGDGFLDMEAVKRGNSATLVRTRADGGVIIKRYNIKSLSKGLRRLLRPLPRYRRAWMSGQLMSFLNLPTARPLVLVEEKRGLLPSVAYLVMEDLGGRELAAEVAEVGLSQSRAAEVARLFVLLKRAELTHGDTKSSNFIVSEGQVYMVDLDAMRLGTAQFDKDVSRFLANWEGEVRDRFESAFQAVELL